MKRRPVVGSTTTPAIQSRRAKSRLAGRLLVITPVMAADMNQGSPAEPGNHRCARCCRVGQEVQANTATGEMLCLSCFTADQRSATPPRESYEDAPPHPERSFGSEEGSGKNSADTSLGESSASQKTSRLAAVLGIPALGEPFGPCVLPGHHGHPSGLIFDVKGPVYYCEACDYPFSLPQVLAVQSYAGIPFRDKRDERCQQPGWEDVHLPGVKVEILRWGERLDYLADLRAPRDMPVFAPPCLSASAKRLLDATQLLLALRHETKWKDDEFTLTRRFSRAVTGFSDHRAKFARIELVSRSILVPTGKAGQANTYRLGTEEEILARMSPSEQEDWLATQIEAEFGAEEAEDG